jgi:3-deoxy-D-manno-octulosonate 8-phosphate phosphatase (KDO 8-P phosphatase)
MPTAQPSRSKRKKERPSLAAALRRIRLVATDVDGVLTDGGMVYAESGEESKRFHVRDGMGIKLLQKAGFITAIITQEQSRLVARRAERLAIPEVHQGIMDKLGALRDLAARYGLSLDQVAYVGDDVNDLEALRGAGFSAAPADAVPAVLQAVRYRCRHRGGDGAVREVADLLLAAQGFDPRGERADAPRGRS